jgi:hypothetical protein
MDILWTLPELVAEVATRIAALPAPKNGQVRAVPDERTVRYYGTLGLLDRPSAMRGRTALYGKRHVAQVVAIKRLQTMGRSLSEIQQVWSTLDDATLTRMSGVELPAAVKPQVRAEFWKREPRRTEPVAGAGAGVPEPGVAPFDAPDAGAMRDSGDMPGSGSTPSHGARGSGSKSSDARGTGAMPSSGAAHGTGSIPSSDEVPVGDAFPAARVVRLGEPVARRSSPGAPAAASGSGARPAAVELRIELAPQIVLSLSVTDESVVISPADVRALRAAAAPLLAALASRRLASHSGGEEP